MPIVFEWNLIVPESSGTAIIGNMGDIILTQDSTCFSANFHILETTLSEVPMAICELANILVEERVTIK